MDNPAITDLAYPSARVDAHVKTGLRPTRNEATAWGTATIPKGQQYVGRKAKKLWKQLVEALLEKSGKVSTSQYLILHSIIRAEIHCQLAERLRRNRWQENTLSIEQFNTISRDIVKTSALRDRMVLELGIDSNELDLFSAALADDPSTQPRTIDADFRRADDVFDDTPEDDPDSA